MEEHRKNRSCEKTVARAAKQKQERAQKKRAEMQKTQTEAKEPTAQMQRLT
jgi:hypothetical protein